MTGFLNESLRKRILSVIPSKQIRDYLEGCLEKLYADQIARLVLHANIPLTEKADLMNELSGSGVVQNGSDEEREECGFYAEMLQKAVRNMEYHEEEGSGICEDAFKHSVYLSSYFVPIAPLLTAEISETDFSEEDAWMLKGC